MSGDHRHFLHRLGASARDCNLLSHNNSQPRSKNRRGDTRVYLENIHARQQVRPDTKYTQTQSRVPGKQTTKGKVICDVILAEIYTVISRVSTPGAISWRVCKHGNGADTLLEGEGVARAQEITVKQYFNY